jgi:hypothetical protein
VLANAAIVQAGTSGSIDVFASSATQLIVDINGYYAAQSGITLTQGAAGAPSLSFASDIGTGLFSTGAGSLSVATNGITRLTVDSTGDVSIGGNLRITGASSGIVFPDSTTQTTAHEPLWFTAFLPGSFSSPWTGASIVPDQTIAIKRLTVALKTAGACGPAGIRVSNGSAGQDVMVNTGSLSYDSGIETIPLAAGLPVTVQVKRTCSPNPPADANVLVQYTPVPSGTPTTCGAGNTAACSGICTDLDRDPSNCGTCNHVCSTPNNSSPTCGMAICSFVCNPGFGDCNNMSSDGCEVNLNSDSRNCGTCGHICPMGTFCVSGVCQ